MDRAPSSPPPTGAARPLRAYGAASLRAYGAWLSLALLAAAIAVIALPASGAEDGEDALSDPVVFAETSYANVCAECHGSAGQGGRVPGTQDEAPPIDEGSGVTPAYLDLVMRTGRMPPPGDPFDNRAREVFYTPVERAAMVAWISEAFDLEGDIPEVGEGDIAMGLESFALNCAHCHGNAGAGGTAGATAFTPQVAQLDPIAIVEAIRVGPFEMPAFTTDQIPEEEADSIAAYLQAVDAEGGTPVLGLVELNPVFASGFVGLLAIALLGSLLYIGGRPISFDHVDATQIRSEVKRPPGQTPMPGDPGYDEPMDLPREQRHENLPYLDEDDGAPTSGKTTREPADEQGADDPGPAPDPPHDQPADRQSPDDPPIGQQTAEGQAPSEEDPRT